MTAREQLQELLHIQELALEIRRAQELVDRGPERLAEIESRFRERNAEYVAVRERFDELEKDQKWRSDELATLEERRKKLMDDLMQVKNQREYAAMLKEIDAVKAVIADHEEAVLKDMEEIEKLKGELANHESTISKERESVGRERAQVETEVERARAVIDERTREREEAEAHLPAELTSTLRKLELTRQGVFLSRADGGTCQSCFVRIRPQVFQEIKLAAAVHTCGSCKRFLYYEPALRPRREKAGANGIEAVNGGAV